MYLRGPGWLNSYKPITNTAWVCARLCKLQKGCTRLAAASDKAYQLLAHGRWFSPGIPAFFTTKTSRHYIAQILLKVALNTINQINVLDVRTCIHLTSVYYVLCVRPMRTCLQCTKYFVHVMYMYTLTLGVQRTLCTYMHTLAFRYNVFCVCTCTHLPSVYNVLCVRRCTHLPSVYNALCVCTCTLTFGVQCTVCTYMYTLTFSVQCILSMYMYTLTFSVQCTLCTYMYTQSLAFGAQCILCTYMYTLTFGV